MNDFVLSSRFLIGRLDPVYHQNIYLVNDLDKKYENLPLSKLIKNSPQYGANERSLDGNPESDIRYIRITDIDNFGNLKKTSWKTAENIDQKYLLEDDDLLFARSGSVGKTLLYKKTMGTAIFAGYLIRFQLDLDKVFPEYVFYYTQMKKFTLWVNAIQRTSVQPNINSKEFGSFMIPIPPKNIQKKIIEIVKKGNMLKNEKVKQSELLLGSLNSILTNNLKIKISKPIIIFPKIYRINSRELISNRFDVSFHYPEYSKILENIRKNNSYNVIPFDDLIIDLFNGVEIRKYVSKGIPYLRVSDMTKIGIDLSNVKYVENSLNSLSSRIQLKFNDILVSRSGSLGLIDLVEDERVKNSIISSHIIRIILKHNDVNPKYLVLYLRSIFGQIQIFKNKIGAVIPEITQNSLKSLLIILPPKDTQDLIVEEVSKNIKLAKAIQLNLLESYYSYLSSANELLI